MLAGLATVSVAVTFTGCSWLRHDNWSNVHVRYRGHAPRMIARWHFTYKFGAQDSQPSWPLLVYTPDFKESKDLHLRRAGGPVDSAFTVSRDSLERIRFVYEDSSTTGHAAYAIVRERNGAEHRYTGADFCPPDAFLSKLKYVFEQEVILEEGQYGNVYREPYRLNLSKILVGEQPGRTEVDPFHYRGDVLPVDEVVFDPS